MGFLKLRNNQKGFTLMEIILSFTLLTIIMAMCLSIMLFSSNVLTGGSARETVKMVGDGVYSTLNKELTYATRVQTLPEGSDPKTAKYANVLFVKNGVLYMGPKENPTPVYDNAIYQKCILNITVEAPDSTAIAVTATLMRDGESQYETGATFQLINLVSSPDMLTIEGMTGKMKNPVISYDKTPYSIKETVETPLENPPYTVARYAEGKTTLQLETGRTYNKGEIVEYKGDLWQVVSTFTYNGDPAHRPGHPGNYLWKSLDPNWKNHAQKSVYNMYDVVIYDGKYMMSIIGGVNTWSPDTSGCWREVFWFPEKETKEDPWQGWSASKDSYVAIVIRKP